MLEVHRFLLEIEDLDGHLGGVLEHLVLVFHPDHLDESLDQFVEGVQTVLADVGIAQGEHLDDEVEDEGGVFAVNVKVLDVGVDGHLLIQEGEGGLDLGDEDVELGVALVLKVPLKVGVDFDDLGKGLANIHYNRRFHSLLRIDPISQHTPLHPHSIRGPHK